MRVYREYFTTVLKASGRLEPPQDDVGAWALHSVVPGSEDDLPLALWYREVCGDCCGDPSLADAWACPRHPDLTDCPDDCPDVTCAGCHGVEPSAGIYEVPGA